MCFTNAAGNLIEPEKIVPKPTLDWWCGSNTFSVITRYDILKTTLLR